ncbi:MAG: HNH endonuclease signature motif containing protein [Flavobacteriaceae bacterium]|nr:HNH endonuclease signature motif containing protein [Flavobacteriaceae bacterium]
MLNNLNILLVDISEGEQGLIVVGLLILFFGGGMIWASIENSNIKSELMRKLDDGSVDLDDYYTAENNEWAYEADRIKQFLDKQHDEELQEVALEESKNTRFENSDFNVKQALNKIKNQTHICNKCFSSYMRIWNLNSSLIELRCENCKKKFTYLNDSIEGVDLNILIDDIELLLRRYNVQKINKYFRTIDFKFDYEGQKSNSPNTYPITLSPKLEAIKGKTKGKSISPKEGDARSRRILQEVKDQVWNRDGGKCVECGSNENLEFDHIIPFSKGGANTYRNIQLLCEHCNRSKSNSIG